MIYVLREMEEQYNGYLIQKQEIQFQQDTDADATAFADKWAKNVTDDRLVVVSRPDVSTPLFERRGLVGIGQMRDVS